LGLTGTKVARGLIDSHPTNGAGYVSNTLWTNSIPIHHPEKNELFAALRAPGDKLVHKALSHTGFSAPTPREVLVFPTSDHGAAYLLIILFALAMQTPIPLTECLNSLPGRCVPFREQQGRMSLSPAGRPKEEAGILLWSGRRSHLSAANPWSSIRGLGLHEEPGLPGVCKKTESPRAKCVTKDKSFSCRITSSELFASPPCS